MINKNELIQSGLLGSDVTAPFPSLLAGEGHSVVTWHGDCGLNAEVNTRLRVEVRFCVRLGETAAWRKCRCWPSPWAWWPRWAASTAAPRPRWVRFWPRWARFHKDGDFFTNTWSGISKPVFLKKIFCEYYLIWRRWQTENVWKHLERWTTLLWRFVSSERRHNMKLIF